MIRDVNIWSDETSTALRDPQNPELCTIAWSVKPGVRIEDVRLLEETMIVVRVRVPPHVEMEGIERP